MKDKIEFIADGKIKELSYVGSEGSKIFIDPPIKLKPDFRYFIDIDEGTIKIWECIVYQPMKFEQEQ